MKERHFSLLIILLGCTVLSLSLGLEVRFLNEPIGPSKFPILLGAGLVLLGSITLWCSRAAAPQAPNRRVIRLLVILLIYYLSFNLLGFMLSTTIAAYLVGRLAGGTWMQSLLTSLLVAIVFYGVFHFLLGVSLPLGTVFAAGG